MTPEAGWLASPPRPIHACPSTLTSPAVSIRGSYIEIWCSGAFVQGEESAVQSTNGDKSRHVSPPDGP